MLQRVDRSWGKESIVGALVEEHLHDVPTIWLRLPAGSTLYREGDRGDTVYLVVSGEMQAGIGSATRTLGPGSVLGEVEWMVGSRHHESMTCACDAELRGVTRSALEALWKRSPRLREPLMRQALARGGERVLERRLFECFPLLRSQPLLLAELRRSMTWLKLGQGEVLCRMGDEADAMYLVVRGRLLVLADDEAAPPRTTLGPGDLVGEWGLLSGGRRTATVVAGRTSHVARLGRAAFEQLSEGNAAFVRQIATSVVEHALRREGAKQEASETFAALRISTSPAARDVVHALAAAVAGVRPTAGVGEANARREFHIDALELGTDEGDAVRIEAWLDRLEEQSGGLWLDAGDGSSAWDRLAMARADHVVLVADALETPELRPIERTLFGDAETYRQVVSLVLVHPAGTRLPSGTARWLAPRRLRGHHHVALGMDGDVHRAARLLLRCGVGLVLGGGGALGAAHVGLIAALLEAGVPIDCVGGTSAGGGIAAALAMQRDFDSFHDLVVRHFVDDNPMRHLTLPVISLVKRSAVDRTAQSMFGDAQIEDLWVPSFCVSANLRTGQAMVHRTGPLWRAVRATSSIPGLLPPMLEDGDVLVDGGILDNFPVKTMAAICGGKMIGSELTGTAGDGKTTHRYEDLPGTAGLVRSWLRLAPRARRLPTIRYVLLQLAMIGDKPQRQARVDACTWHFRPDLRGFSLSDYRRFAEVATIGYREAKQKLAQLAVSSLVPGWTPRTPASHRPPAAGLPGWFGAAAQPAAGQPAVLARQASPGRRPTGQVYGHLSLKPLSSMKALRNGFTPTLRQARARAGAPVFRVHLGQPMVVASDAVSADFVFRADPELLDRGPAGTFGPVGLRPELVQVAPVLTADRVTHAPLAAFAHEVLERRRGSFGSVLERVADRVFAEWVQARRVGLKTGLRDLVARAVAEWLLEVQVRQDDVNLFLAHVFRPLPSGAVSSGVARAATGCPREGIEIGRRLRALAAGSPCRAEIEALGARHGVERPLEQLLFMALFNAAGGASGVLMPAVLEIERSASLRSLVEGDASLEALVLECHRLYGRPALFIRDARRNFRLPSSEGDFLIDAGTRILLPTRMFQTDPGVFDEPQRFDPGRYQRSPREREFVYASGAPTGTASGYRCSAADNGVQNELVASTLRLLFRRLRWRTSHPPVFDEGLDLYVGPDDMELLAIEPRGQQVGQR